ncbi:hypothetical protein J6590_104540 [Homalodisca vitripennis]|nr:hypothetical protein J6590_104540 [Homalodisca vitripennis]
MNEIDTVCLQTGPQSSGLWTLLNTYCVPYRSLNWKPLFIAQVSNMRHKQTTSLHVLIRVP